MSSNKGIIHQSTKVTDVGRVNLIFWGAFDKN